MPLPLLVVLLGWLALGLETSLTSVLAVPVGTVLAGPSFVIPLAVFIGLAAPARATQWSALGLGIGMDLLTPRPTPGDTITVVGPYAIGMLLAMQFVLASRSMVMRRNPLTCAAVSVPAAAIVHIVVVAIFTARHLYDGSIVWDTTGQLGARAIGTLMTGVSALVVGVMLMPLAPALGLTGIGTRGRR